MDAYIHNYLGEWEDERGNRLSIRKVDDKTAFVSFFAAPAGKPVLRPWHHDEPTVDMLGSYQPEEGAELLVELGKLGGGFMLHLDFQPAYTLDPRGRDALVPALSRYEGDTFLDQYHWFFDPLKHYTRCRSVLNKI
ncbi:MAG: hypothetical protein HYU76_14295 [Betaproteobacteria bacterium]|nr:hypothetical protein [Betaproteobacteria bacterium]